MKFSCPPQTLVNFLLERLAFSGQYGISLDEFWRIACEKLQLNILEPHQKQLIWGWLYYEDTEKVKNHSHILKGDTILKIDINYEKFISNEGNEAALKVVPSADTQWFFLTNFGTSKKLKVQLGEYPFQLLCEISKYGAQGIFSPDLCKATGQDPRSLTLRLKKLEELGLIVKKNVYNEKMSQHTNLCMHSRYAAQGLGVSNSSYDEDFNSSRNVNKLKIYIIESLKNAPNNLRGFKDLKKELGLDKGRSAGKFFRSIVEYLHRHGYAERLMVKDPSQSSLVHCIKYIKDIPKAAHAMSEDVDIIDIANETPSNEEEDDKDTLPSFSILYPLSIQLYNEIYDSKSKGITSMELMKNISGVSDYRPLVKTLDSITAFTANSNKLRLNSGNPEFSDKKAVVRTYDFDGKFKFYRYFTISHYQNAELPPKPKQDKKKRNRKQIHASLLEVNMSLYHPLGKITSGPLLKTRKHKAEEKKSFKTPTKKRKKDSEYEVSESGSLGSSKKDKFASDNSECFTATATPNILPTEDFDKKNIDNDHPSNVVTRLPHVTNSKVEKKKFSKKTGSSESLKALRRRGELLNIIQEMGGVTYTTANLCRKIDEKLGNSTVTDKRTLARDISVLINGGELEVHDINFVRSGQQVTRKLLILTNKKLRPSEQEIERVKAQCIEDQGNKAVIQSTKRIIEGSVTLYSTNNEKEVRSSSKRKRSNTEVVNSKVKIHPEDMEKRLINTTVDDYSNPIHNNFEVEEKDKDQIGSLTSLVQRKGGRKKKAQVKDEISKNISNLKRGRYSIKFGKEDTTTLFRAVVICRTFKRGSIDFEQIAQVFPDMNASEIKSKWTSIRRLMGGLPAVLKGISSFEHVVRIAIKNGTVKLQDLENLSIPFFLELWKGLDNLGQETFDENPLYKERKDNETAYIFTDLSTNSSDLYEAIEDNSMRQKEMILAGTTFAYSEPPEIVIPAYDKVKTVLKAIFSLPEDMFNGEKVNAILSEFEENIIKQASMDLIKDKEISYSSGISDSARFTLTEKVYNSLNHKPLTPNMLKQSATLMHNISSVFESNKGLLISPGISNGEMIVLLSLVSRFDLDVLHLDRFYKFEGYESRLIDKEKLSCNILCLPTSKRATKFPDLVSVSVPLGKPCSHFWIDINGNINSYMWSKCIVSVLYYIVFRPGINKSVLYQKLKVILSFFDFELLLKWLIKTGSIRDGEFGGLWITDNWFSTIGS